MGLVRDIPVQKKDVADRISRPELQVPSEEMSTPSDEFEYARKEQMTPLTRINLLCAIFPP